MIALIRRSMEQIDRDLQATSAAVAELQTTASGVAETREAQRVASDVHTSPLRAMWKGYAEHGSQEQKLASIERAWRAERSRREVARLSRLLGDALRQLSTYSRRSAALWELRAVLQSRWSRAEELKGASAEDLENLRVELMEFCRVVEGVEQKLEEAILMLVVLRGQT